MIEVKKSNTHGEGVFSTQQIKKGTVVDFDVILINKNIRLKKLKLNIYSFPWDKTQYSLCFGWASYLNHKDQPNIKILKIDKLNLKKYFIVLEDINVGDELFLNYGGKNLTFF